MKNDLKRPHISLETPITYHVYLHEQFDSWARDCGLEPTHLREATEEAIRQRHNTEGAVDEIDRAMELQPDVFNLNLNRQVKTFYTIEEDIVVVRGYAWELQGEPRDVFDGGSYFCEPSWYPERLEKYWANELCLRHEL